MVSQEPITGVWPGHGKVTVACAGGHDRESIYRLRHVIYASELAQHPESPEGKLRDALDGTNTYITATVDREIVGFVSITPPASPVYSIDKYLSRCDLPFPFDERLYEVRLLTVARPHRGQGIGTLLMYAALRWVEARGGTRIIAIGRRELVDFYIATGLEPLGRKVWSGAVSFEVLTTTIDRVRERLGTYEPLLEKFERTVDWRLGVAFRKPAPCFHGGAFFAAIGDAFDALDRRRQIINADVLDAWYPPSPKVLAALQEHLPWLLSTSPPTACEGMVNTIARVRDVRPECVLPGAGSSDLIFLALRQWLTPSSRALILDPTYGEYAHVLERVVRCRVDRLPLSRHDGYALDPARLESRFAAGYDLIVLVNPNSPTGHHVPREDLERVLGCAPAGTRIWVDETYVEYAGPDQSLERFAAGSENVVVCKSMSKVYALSGLRAGYLCAPPHLIEELRSLTPPWAVSLPAQVAAVMALQDPEYYAARYRETHLLRDELVRSLRRVTGMEIVPSVANFVLCHLPPDGPGAGTVVDQCRADGLFLRDAGATCPGLGTRAIRIAVKDAETNHRVAETIARVLGEGAHPTPRH